MTPEQKVALWLGKSVRVQAEIEKLSCGEPGTCEGLLAEYDYLRSLARKSWSDHMKLRAVGGRLFKMFGVDSLSVLSAWKDAHAVRAENALKKNSELAA